MNVNIGFMGKAGRSRGPALFNNFFQGNIFAKSFPTEPLLATNPSRSLPSQPPGVLYHLVKDEKLHRIVVDAGHRTEDPDVRGDNRGGTKAIV